MDDAVELIRSRTELSDTTFKQYVSQANTLYKIWRVAEHHGIKSIQGVGPGLAKNFAGFDFSAQLERQFLEEVRENPSKIITLIETAYTHGTAKTYLNIIIVYVRSYIENNYMDHAPNELAKKLLPVLESYRIAWKKFQADYEKQVAEGVMTPKQKDSYMTWEEFDAIIQTGIEKWGLFSQQVLTFMLYRHLPLRADYASLIYETEPGGDQGNFYNGRKIVLNNYKTFKTYGTLTSEPPLILKQYLDKYIVDNDMTYGDYFYPNKKKDTHITNNLLSKRVRNYFLQLGVENPPNIQMLRHIYLMNKYGEVKTEMDNDAYIMGHSKTTQDKYILKFND